MILLWSLPFFSYLYKFLIKQELTNLIFWVYPTVSLLSFIGWMNRVYLNTLTLLPTYYMMFMFTIMVRNYRSNEVQNKSWNFKPPQLAEIILSLLLDKDHDDLHYIAPLDVGENTDSFKTPVDHMEYPFSLYEDKNGRKSKYHESGGEIINTI